MRSILPMALLTLTIVFMESAVGQSGEAAKLVPMLKRGGYVIVLRHGATDPSQRDAYPLNLSDMSKQRQLSEQGRASAREIGAALATNAVPIGHVYTSQLNRAVETGRLVSAKDAEPTADLNDSSAGSAAAMAGQAGGGSARYGEALRRMASTAPAAGTNTLIITHKTNVADAFGKQLADIAEGEAAVFQPDGKDATLLGRIKAEEWVPASRTK